MTIEQFVDDLIGCHSTDLPPASPPNTPYQVNLWDPDRLDAAAREAPLDAARPPGRPAGRQFPLVAISPDGKTVAVAAIRGKFVKLFSALTASRSRGREPKRRRGTREESTAGRDEIDIDTQTELSALALGPNDSLATAGTTPGGVVIKIWNLVDPSTVPTSLLPLNQNYTRLMRFNPQGTLAGDRRRGPDRALGPAGAQPGRRAQDERSGDRSGFRTRRPDAGRGGPCRRDTSVWTVYDSAVRTQLSGFESPPSSLAFNDEACWPAPAGAAMFGSGAAAAARRSARRCRSRRNRNRLERLAPIPTA